MKIQTLIIAILTIAGMEKINAQVPITTYDTCNKLQQYAGEWRYTNGSDTIRIFLRVHHSLNENFDIFISDRLWGWHEYKSGNTIIESNYQNRFNAIPFITTQIGSEVYSIDLRLKTCFDTTKTLEGSITDYNHSYYNKIEIVLDPTKTIMVWKQQRVMSDMHNPSSTMTLPRSFILYKQ